MEGNNPYIALILRDTNLGTFVAHHTLQPAKDLLEHKGYRVITSTDIDTFPRDQIPELDLVIAHVGAEGDGTLEEQAKLAMFVEAGVTVVTRLGTAESIMDKRFMGLSPYGRIGEDFYMKHDAKIDDAVDYFLTEMKKQT